MRALISVSDKTNLIPFAKSLTSLGWEIIATGGTQKILTDNGITTINIEDITGFPEICDGRVKTLHPKVHGGLLARRDDPSHLEALKQNAIEFIDLVCVNLYPFKATIANPDVDMRDAIENIDIGGPSMLRSAAKNYADVTVVCNPDNYNQIIDEITALGNTSLPTRLKLSAEAYTHTAEYDMMISTYMRKQAGLNERLFLAYDKIQDLRYGENPHQSAAFFRETECLDKDFSIANGTQIHGKELSYNNIQDANAALCITREFTAPFCCALKHMNPCGAAIGKNLMEAWTRTYEADKVSIFGGIVATNQEITADVAKLMHPIFLEIIIAPSFSPEALEILTTKKNLRLIIVDMTPSVKDKYQYVSVNGGLLVQQQDTFMADINASMCVTDTKPTDEQITDLAFGMRIVKHVKSNAIVVVRNGQTLGVGAGQMNRIGSAQLALNQAHANGVTSDLVLASDAFFPFDDCVTLANQMGVKAIIQPGGSVRDNDSIQAANQHNITMLFSGNRHFKH